MVGRMGSRSLGRAVRWGLVGLALVVGACSTGDGGGAGSSSDSASPEGAAVAGAGGAADGGGASTGAAEVTPAQVASAAADRKRTYTASLDLEVERLDAAVREATRVVEGLGGFAASEQVDLGDARVATVTFRVPADGFRAALRALDGVGELRHQDVDSVDVTGTYADLEGRVATLRTSVGRLQGFLAEATDVNQIGLLEGELTRREAELESIESQRRALADQIALSTITVDFDAATAVPATEDRTLPSFLGGLESGWDAAVAAGSVLVAVLGFVLPFLPVVVVLWFLLRRWRRNGRGSVGDTAPAA